MFYLYILVLCAIQNLPGLQSQCFYCDDHWKTHCKVSARGYHCTEGARIVKKPGDITIKLWDTCAPYERKIEYVEDYCCVFSPENGCYVGLNPDLYRAGPGNYCNKCAVHCDCAYQSGSMLQPWHWCGLCLIIMCLTFIIPNS